MITFICLFFPAVLSVFAYEKLMKKDLRAKQWIYLYVTGVLFTNLGCFFIKSMVLGTGGTPIFDLYSDMPPSGAMNYLIMTIPIAIALAVVEALLEKTLKFSIEDSENGKK